MTYVSYELDVLRSECDRLRAENTVLRDANQGLAAGGNKVWHDHATMLATLTATQKRCTEQEQRIRDQERELEELRGKQGAVIDPAYGPFIQGWLADVNQHDTAEQAIEAAKVRARCRSDSGKSFVAQVARTFLLIPARAERMEEEDFASPF